MRLRRFAVIGAAQRSRCHNSSAQRCCGRRYRQQVLAIRYPAPTVGLSALVEVCDRTYCPGKTPMQTFSWMLCL